MATFKVVLWDERDTNRAGPPDIRRLSIEHGGVSVENVKDEINQRITPLKLVGDLSYCKSNGNLVTVGSDDDLQIALFAGVAKFLGATTSNTPHSLPHEMSSSPATSSTSIPCQEPILSEGEAMEIPVLQHAASVDWTTTLNFWVNGEAVVIENPSPSLTLLEWLRSHKGITGIHVGCGEGGCGICTVALVKAGPDGETDTVPINSCLRRLCALDGCHIVTTQGIGCKRDGFHAVQSAIADGNGSQCGFCTPGWVMQMYSLLQKTPSPSQSDIEQHFDGNLCRCTGYRPILTAFKKFAAGGELDGALSGVKQPAALLKASTINPLHFTDPQTNMDYYRPTSLAELFQIASATSTAQRPLRMICANTGEGVIKYYTPPSRTEDNYVLVDLSVIPDIQGINPNAVSMVCGATASISSVIDALEQLKDTYPAFGVLADHMLRIASVQIRSVASWAGNIMLAREHRNFPSDMVTILSAAGATISYMDLAAAAPSILTATVPQLLALTGDLLVVKMTIPNIPTASLFQTYKTSQRHVFAHAIVNMGARIDFAPDKTVSNARLIIGGATPTLLDASAVAMATLKGKTMSQTTLDQLCGAIQLELRNDPNPDLRHSMSYRANLAVGYLYKLFLAAQSTVNPREKSALVPFVPANARPISSGIESYATVQANDPVSEYIPKIQSRVQASGEVKYPSDHGNGALWAQPVFSTSANAKLSAIDTSSALKFPGVVDFITAASVPSGGINCICPALGGDNLKEKVFWSVGDTIPSVGVMLGVIVAESWPQARVAAKQVVQTYAAVEPVVTNIDEAIQLRRYAQNNDFSGATPARRRGIKRGEQCLTSVQYSKAPRRTNANLTASGTFKTGGQRHFYMETQSALAIPLDGDRWEFVISDQDSNFTQANLSQILGISASKINVKVPRAGGAFGGKLTRQLICASAVAIAASKLQKPVRIQLERSDDMQIVAGREPMTFTYTSTFDSTGKIDALDLVMAIDGGWFYGDVVGDLEMGLGWSDNCYHWSNFSAKGQSVVSDTPHSTSMRAPGCMQSILAAEVIMEHISKVVGKDVDEIREMNFYKLENNPVTPFGDHIGQFGYNWTIPLLWSQIQRDAQYQQRKADVATFNAANKWVKKGIAISPVKYTMGTQFYQSGALICVYEDGSVMVSTGGSEIGQGLNTKVTLCVANVLGIDASRITVGPRETSKVPNNTPTGGSGTSESSSHAAMIAANTILTNLGPYLSKGQSWEDAVQSAIQDGVSLMASAFYQCHDDQNANLYSTYGVAISEVMLDAVTGEVRVEKVDILMDLGTQLDAAVDLGQLEGGFIISLGYLLTEELVVDASGTQLNLGTWEYKIPSAYDIPVEFNVSLLKDSPNPVGVMGSKASAEPGMCLMPSLYLAVKNAVYAARSEVGNGDQWFELNHPLTAENIRSAIGTYSFDL